MLIKLFYSILDASNTLFDNNIDITASEYEVMLFNKINENNAILNGFTPNNISDSDLYYNSHLNGQKNNVNDNYIQYPCEAFMTHINDREICFDDIKQLSLDNKMSMFRLNINPNDLDYDVYSDLKQWIGESNNIKNNININEKDKIAILPSRNLNIEIEGNKFTLNNVKIIKDYSDNNFPFNFVVLIEKITL